MLLLLNPTGYVSPADFPCTQGLPRFSAVLTSTSGASLENAARHRHVIWRLLLPVWPLMTSRTPPRLCLREQGGHFARAVCASFVTVLCANSGDWRWSLEHQRCKEVFCAVWCSPWVKMRFIALELGHKCLCWKQGSIMLTHIATYVARVVLEIRLSYVQHVLSQM